MTIDAIRARKRELLARKKYEQERLERGEGDKLVFAEIGEELLDVNAQLRALIGKARKKKRDTNSGHAMDRQAFLSWRERDDGEADGARDRMRTAATESLQSLTKTQRQTLELYAAGYSVTRIAAMRGVLVSTVSRILSRARKNAAEETARTVEGQRLMDEARRVDLHSERAMRAVVMAMTAKQLIYFYLYYSEGLSLREIEKITGTHYTAVSRTIFRAKLKLDRLFGGQNVVLEHPEALDEAAYLVYCELEKHPEQVPEQFRPAAHRPVSQDRKRVWTEEDRQKRVRMWLARPAVLIRRGKSAGRLLALLRARAGECVHWLEALFRRLRKIFGRAG